MGNIFSCSLSLDNVFSRCLVCTSRHINYAWELGEDVKILQNDWEELKRRRSDIKERIEAEERDPHMKRLEEVAGWLSDADSMEAAGVDQLIENGIQASENTCCGGCCPKGYTTNYKLGGKVAKKQREVTSLKSKGIFDVVTHRSSLPPTDERPAKLTLGLESTFDEVWNSLIDEKVGTIGLYGMGGVGKTTLLTEVNNKLLLCNNPIDGGKVCSLSFNVVIWIVVSQTPNLTKVQDDIGEKIGLRIDSEEWKIKSQEKKAIDIFKLLKEKKFVLFLDDIWEGLDLNKLGVPSFPNQNNKSKVVFTTRSKEVCGRMEAHKLIQVKCLAWKEAWDLFQQKVGKETLKAHSEIPDLAKDVARECAGLPLALITIGRAMAYKTSPQAWHHAINLLKRYASEFSGMEEEVYSLLKFSYDSLPNSIVRSCLLYCSLYPEDWEIYKEELIEKWICEGFLIKFEDDLCKSRNEGHHYISILVHASLLEECSPKKVKMHDVIRDMALWIACDCGAANNKFFVQAGAGLRETSSVAHWEGAERVSLMNNTIREFTETPVCPNLVTLFLNNNKCTRFSIGFFQSMRNLRVLDLSKNSNLNGFLEEISELVSLQYLNLSNNLMSTGEFPIRLQKLINLKCLNLSCIDFGVIPEELLSSFKKLQILKLNQYNEIGGSMRFLPKTFVEELESLKYLNDLKISVTDDFEFSNFSSSHKLTSITTSLNITRIECMRDQDWLFLKRMTNLKRLAIYDCGQLEEIIYVGQGKTRSSEIRNEINCFHSLHSFTIIGCRKIKNLIWLAFAPNIEVIAILDCSEMKELVVGKHMECDEVADDEEEEGGRPININITPFAKLTTLSLYELPQLESIYPSALSYPCLKELTVSNCPKLKKLPFNSSSSCKSGITIVGSKEWWNEVLEWEDETTRLAFQSSFKPV